MDNRVTMVGGERALTPTDYKTLEGQRIQAVMAAVAALPGAALVASGPSGSPFFAAALVTVAASFAFWIFTDAIYHYSMVKPRSDLEWKQMMNASLHFFWAHVGYLIASIGLTMAGFAAVHSGIKTNVSVAAGFGVAALIAFVVAAHVIWSANLRNTLGQLTREASVANKVAN